MSQKEIWFRTSDGREMVAPEGSVAHSIMKTDGAFTLISGPGGEAASAAAAETAEIDLTKLTKKDLLAYAEANGIEVNPKLKVSDIIDVIEAAGEAEKA